MAAYTHNGDHALLESLGLRADWDAEGEWVDLGTVVVQERSGHEIPATVKVEVYAAPAQFYRFTVVRPDEDDRRTADTLTIRTGSGGFSTFWPTAKLVAENMIQIDEER